MEKLPMWTYSKSMGRFLEVMAFLRVAKKKTYPDTGDGQITSITWRGKVYITAYVKPINYLSVHQVLERYK